LARDRQFSEQQGPRAEGELAVELQDRMQQREQLLRSAEAILANHSQQLDADRVALAADRQAWEEQKERHEKVVTERRAAAEDELSERRQRLDARQEWVERQKAGLEQVRSEIFGLHRQSLEMRLLAEQLWSQITGRLTPAEVTHAIAQLRLHLAEQYRVEEQDLLARKEELLKLGERIAQQHQELTQLRSGLRDWVAARQAEIEGQAATLVKRELALDEQQAEARQAQQQWHVDRRRYEQQIRDLTSQLRSLPVAA
jgi:hypothetical protein